jgi:predicted hydrocarbon binding protein
VAITKGITFTHARSYVEGTFGATGWNAVLQHSRPDDRATLGGIVAVGWYELDLYARLLRSIDSALGRGDLELMAAIGRYGAEKDLNTVYRLFFRLQSPAYAIEKVAEYWRKFHDTGVWTVEREGSGKARGTLRDWGCVDRALCREMMAYMTRVLELVGAKEVRLSHPRCRADGETECFFSLRWKGKDGS